MQRFAEMALMVSVVVGLQLSGVSPSGAADLAARLVLPEATAVSSALSRESPVRVAQNTEAQSDGQADYRYDAEGRRDPFESLVKEEETPVVAPGPVRDPSRPRGPLERFDLSALQLTGIVWGDVGRHAVVRAPDGKGYFVTVGMYMGQNGGQVVEIDEHRMVILEKHRDVKGSIIDKTLTIPLRRKE